MTTDKAPVYQAYLSLVRGRTLPERTREREMAEVALRQWWHALFDPCPTVLQSLCPPDAGDLFRRFFDWVDSARPSMGWSLHLHLLAWLRQDSRYQDALSVEMVLELLAAAASRWAIFDRGPDTGVVLGDPAWTDRVVAGWKCRTPGRGRLVEVLRTSGNLGLGSRPGCFYVPDFRVEVFGPWQDIPE